VRIRVRRPEGITWQDPVSQILLIDEPEMHIYPTQKRWLGQQLVRLAQSQRKQVFMVTHDPISFLATGEHIAQDGTSRGNPAQIRGMDLR
jgi:ABC-type nitrate/sulfonate/bicarbonate transport system ATPase subunit